MGFRSALTPAGIVVVAVRQARQLLQCMVVQILVLIGGGPATTTAGVGIALRSSSPSHHTTTAPPDPSLQQVHRVLSNATTACET
jgi:hypothetical protein